MNYKRFWTVLGCLAAAIVCALTSGCGIAPDGAEVEWLDVDEYRDEQTKGAGCIYETRYVDVSFVTGEQTKTWREPLVALLSNEMIEICDESGVLAGYTALYPEKPCVRNGRRIGLFDVDIDGTPELLVDLGGGNAGNAVYCVYDIMSGKELGYLNGGYNGSLTAYFNRSTGRYESIGSFELRSGSVGKSRIINKATLVSTVMWDEKRVYESCYLYAYYSFDLIELELTKEDIEAGYEFAYDTVCSGVTFEVNGCKALSEDYFAEYDSFRECCIPISETSLRLIDRDVVCSEEDGIETQARKIADALLSSGQKFIVG